MQYIIDTYGEDFLGKILLNKSEHLDKLVSSYTNQFEPDKLSDTMHLLTKESLDHYVLKRLLESENYTKNPEFKAYCKYIYKVIAKIK